MRWSPGNSLLLVVAVLVPGGAGADTLRFGWPVPAKVMVTERVVKEGTAAVMSYQVTLTPTSDGQRLMVRQSGFDFVEINGQDARHPAIRKQLAPALKAVSKDSPTLIIGRDGAFQEVADFKALVAGVVALAPAANRAAARKLVASPQFIALLQEASAQFWNVWVGMWIGAEVPAGRPLRLEQAVQLSNGSTFKRPLTITNHGPAGPPGNVRLAFESVLEGDQGKFRSLVEGALPETAGPGKPMANLGQFVGSVSLSGEVVTDPETLRPATARWQKRTTAQTEGRARTTEETHDYTFTWTKAAPRTR
jgi:hypothetical protein